MSKDMSPNAKENKNQEKPDERMQEEDDVDDVTDEGNLLALLNSSLLRCL